MLTETDLASDPTTAPAATVERLSRLAAALHAWPARIALGVLVLVVVVAVCAPLLGTSNPSQIDPSARLAPPSAAHFMGTDALGRDVYSRVLYGARVSLVVGLGVASASIALGLLLGVLAGYFPFADALIMRIMDGLMAVPGILLAIALVALIGGSVPTLILAITIPEMPRVVRLVRSVILTARGEPYVEAAVSLGTPTGVLLVRHMVPSTVAPLIVQGTFVFASAMLIEAAMSFLGVGLPPDVPSWGNIMADGRNYFELRPGLIFFAGTFLALTVLSINVLGDTIRDVLDPKLATRA